MPRLFAAFTLSDAARAEVARVASSLGLRGVSEVPAENLHVTVAFIGERPDVDAVEDALRAGAAECAPAAVRLGMLGGFPTPRRATVVWVGVSDPSGVIGRDAQVLIGALERGGVAVTMRHGWVPHVTVARIRRRAQPVTLPAPAVAPVAFTVASVELFESVLRGSRPPRYEVLASLPFSRSARSS